MGGGGEREKGGKKGGREKREGRKEGREWKEGRKVVGVGQRRERKM